MIVVVGVPAWRAATSAAPAAPAGRATAVALAAAAAGACVELVGRAGDDAAGDMLVLALAAGRVGHVALLRDPARPTPLASDVGELDSAADVAGVGADPADWRAETGSRPGDPVLEAADVEMGLRYLTDFSVLVMIDGLPPDALAVGAEAAAYASAKLVVLIGDDVPAPRDLPAGATVLEVPAFDPDDAFAALVGRYAAALDRGEDPRRAFAAAVTRSGWETSGA